MSDARLGVAIGFSGWRTRAVLGILLIGSPCAAMQGDSGGTVIASADLAGDGVNEVIECVPAWNSDAGAVDVFDGATQSLIVRFVGAAGSRFGWSCATVPDINGDGLAELLIGAPGEQRAYLALGPFVDVAELQVDASRLNLILEPASGMPTVNFGLDVGGLHDLDGDTRPDLRVAAMELDANGTQHSVTLVFQGITGALVGIGRRALPSDTLEAASGDADKDATVGGTDMARVIEALGTATDAGATKGDVTLDGAVDWADAGLVLEEWGTQLYLEVDPALGRCGAEAYRTEALGEAICVEVVARSTVGGVLMVGQSPAEITQPSPNPCGDQIDSCLQDPSVRAALDRIVHACWPAEPAGFVIGHIYCSPCKDSPEGELGFTSPRCAGLQTPGVDLTICASAGADFCAVLAHELVHVSQACRTGLFNADSCNQFWGTWNDPRGRICMELEAYASATNCALGSLSGCCDEACDSATQRWQDDQVACRGCCDGGLLLPNCDGAAIGWCRLEDPNAP